MFNTDFDLDEMGTDSQQSEHRVMIELPKRFYARLMYTRQWNVGRPRMLAIVRLKSATQFRNVRAEFVRQHALTLCSGMLDPASFCLRAASEDGSIIELHDNDTPEGVRLMVSNAQEVSELLDGASQISPQVLYSQRDVHLRRCFIA